MSRVLSLRMPLPPSVPPSPPLAFWMKALPEMFRVLVAVDAVAAVILAVAALRVFDGAAGDVQGAVAVDAVAGVKVAFAALRFFDGAALLNRDGNIPVTVAAADAVAGAATHGLLDGAARDGDIGISAVVTAADAGTIVAALGFYGAAGDVDGGSAEGVCAAADACAALLGLRLDFGTAGDGDMLVLPVALQPLPMPAPSEAPMAVMSPPVISMSPAPLSL